MVLDGILDEEVWRLVQPATEFIQQDPNEGEPAEQRTEVRFAYDAEALYIGARMHDSQGAAGVRTRLARRDDDVEGDYLMLTFDTFHDHAGRTTFRVNPSGVKYEAGQASPSENPSWDPIWEVATQIDSLGWTAEAKIPFSQLRFSRDTAQTWGLQIWRYVDRLNERSMWSFWGKEEAGGPARFGHLEALHIASRARAIELMPYVMARGSYVRPDDPGNPFESAQTHDWRVGADVKAVLTSDLTLDATINPDFGQVEVDPAVVNLSAFETSFPERRPFFVEGSGLFGFGGLNCFFCSNVSGMSLFYSRRIGRPPQGSLDRLDHDTEFSSIPENTSILGAAKITGRTTDGLQIGLLNAVTGSAKEKAITEDDGRVRREVEPLTNYAVARVRRNMRDGDVSIGAMATSVYRRFGYDSLTLLMPRHAEAGGVDWNVYWADQTYRLMGSFAVSQVSGDSAALSRIQRSSARYFDRPDHDGGSNGIFTKSYDPSLTAMRGFAGYTRLAKDAGPWQWETSLNVRSPGFEVNDLALLTRADFAWMNANIRRQWTRPTRYYRRLTAIAGAQQEYNFDGDLTSRQVQTYLGGELPNYWSGYGWLILRPESDDDRLTRGGPVVRKPGIVALGAGLDTDSRKTLVLGANSEWIRTQEGRISYFVNAYAQVQPASNISLRFDPRYSRDEYSAQYVDRFDDASATDFFGERVVFADILRHTLSVETRLSVTFTPTLTLELFAQPLIASGAYTNFKEFASPRSLDKVVFGRDRGTICRYDAAGDVSYAIDPVATRACPQAAPSGDDPDFRLQFDEPSFNLRSLRGNAVLRWEFRPGSTLFFVWQQQRSGSADHGDFALSRDAGRVFSERPDNVFVIKGSYWLGR